MKKIFMRIITTLVMMICVWIVPASVCATEMPEEESNNESEELAVTGNSVQYTVEDTNLFEGASVEDNILGIIKKGNPVEIVGESGDMYEVTYLGITGYIEKRTVVETFKGYVESQTEDETLMVESNTMPDPLLPASHYVDAFEELENMAAINYMMDEDYSDDYVYVCNSNKIEVNGILLNTAYDNGCPGFTIIYTEDKMSPTLYLKLTSKEVKNEDVMVLSFTYKNGTVIFSDKDQNLLTDVELGFPKDDGVLKVVQNGKQLEEVEDIDNTDDTEDKVVYYKVSDLSDITVDLKVTDNKKIDNKQKETSKFQIWPIIGAAVIVVIIVLALIAIKKKNKHFKRKKL